MLRQIDIIAQLDAAGRESAASSPGTPGNFVPFSRLSTVNYFLSVNYKSVKKERAETGIGLVLFPS